MNTQQITKLITIGQLSLDHWIAEVDSKIAKQAYHDAIKKYEDRHGGERTTFGPGDAICRATKKQYDAYKVAKHTAYNIKRRLNTACMNIPKF